MWSWPLLHPSHLLACTPRAGKMKHYSSPREKKVLILGLVALLSLPEAQLPPEIRPGMPQVRRLLC